MYLNENYNPYSESAESETPVQNGAKVKNRKHIKKDILKNLLPGYVRQYCLEVLRELHFTECIMQAVK